MGEKPPILSKINTQLSIHIRFLAVDVSEGIIIVSVEVS